MKWYDSDNIYIPPLSKRSSIFFNIYFTNLFRLSKKNILRSKTSSDNQIPFLSSEQSPLYRKYSETPVTSSPSDVLLTTSDNSNFSKKSLHPVVGPATQMMAVDNSVVDILNDEEVPDGLRLNEFLSPLVNRDGQTVFSFF
jgi:hypothetical protein